MVKFRRMTKSEGVKRDSARNQISIPHKDAIAIIPPKKVIKALYDYNAPTDPPLYLSFSAGDFLHVVARENDVDWFEACNPLHGSRGLVPVKYFEIVGKTVRDSRASTNSGQSATHDSGYAEPGSTARTTPITPPIQQMAQHMQHPRMSRIGKPGGAMVYGVVSYDFHAERPDELEAKEGEAIIVIAQSNPEWFVAKPITRLGGPGLIPVSFIEIKDMHTGQTVADPQEAVARAGIPKVEEWKKMAADYKNTSIPLGQFGQIPQGMNNIPQVSTGLMQGMDRLSLGSQPNGYGHYRTPSGNTLPQRQSYPLAPLRASVPGVTYADEKYHFTVEVTLSNNSHWDLSRIYEDFYELQIHLIQAFPDEAGQTGHPRVLPFMPGPVQFVTDKITEGRRENLDEYLHNLLRLPPHITGSSLVRGFFAPRGGGDYEVDFNDPAKANHSRSRAAVASDRYSHASQLSQNFYPSAAGQGAGTQSARHSQVYAQPQQQQLISDLAHQRGQPSLGGGTGGLGTAVPMHRQLTQTSTQGGPALKVKVWFDHETCVVVRMPSRGAFTFADLHRKIVERRRLEFGKEPGPGQGTAGGITASDEGVGGAGAGAAGDGIDEVVLGQGATTTDPILDIEYRDERSGEYYLLANDEELERAVMNNEKLTLVVRAVGGA